MHTRMFKNSHRGDRCIGVKILYTYDHRGEHLCCPAIECEGHSHSRKMRKASTDEGILRGAVLVTAFDG